MFERRLIFNLTLEELLALQLFWKKWVTGRGVSIGVRVWGVGGGGGVQLAERPFDYALSKRKAKRSL